MLFLSKNANQRIVCTRSRKERIPLSDGTYDLEPRYGYTAAFDALSEPFEFNDRVWRGEYETEDQEKIEMLLHHDAYGEKFIAVTNDGDVAMPEDAFFQEVQKGILCTACDKLLKDQRAVTGHRTANAHKENIKERRKEILEGARVAT